MTSYTPNDLAVRTILGEAGNQGYSGQLAVANVINNRVQSGQFGAGVSGVITPSQFNGFDSQTPVGSAAWNQAQSAWNAAQAGQDNTGGATYFANPSLSSAQWAKNLNASNSLQIGDQFFTNNTTGAPFNPSSPATSGTSSATGSTGQNSSSAGSSPSSSSSNSSGPFDWTGIPQAIQNATATIDSNVKNLFVRGAVITVGVVVVVVAVWRLADPDGTATKAAITGAAELA